jgi:hypothetical protein
VRIVLAEDLALLCDGMIRLLTAYDCEVVDAVNNGPSLLKDRISDVTQFVEAIRRVAAGGTAMDPEVISQLLSRHQDSSPVASLTPREREVLSHMAVGRSNAASPPGCSSPTRRWANTPTRFRQARARAERGRQPAGARGPGLPGELAAVIGVSGQPARKRITPIHRSGLNLLLRLRLTHPVVGFSECARRTWPP